MDKKEKKVMRIFQMTPETAEQFFLLIMWSTEHGVKDTVGLRQYTLNWLASKNKMSRVYDTKRTEDQVVQDYIKQGLRIKDLRRKKHDMSRRDARDYKGSIMGRLQAALGRVFKILFD